MFNFKSINEYQLEITTYCNAACPQCPRNDLGQGVNPYMPLIHLDRDAIDAAFSVDHCRNLKQIFFCGSYGDPIMHPNFLDILQDFRNKNSTLWLYIHTNGGVHDESYWREIATIMNGYGQIDFGIDGLEDTLHLYRKNVKYNTVMRNARAYIQAGGRAQWNFIVFNHNQHQIESAKQLSKDYGFVSFLPRKTGRFYDHQNETEFDTWPVMHKNKISYLLEPPTVEEWRNPSTQRIEFIKKDFKDFRSYLEQTAIKCDAALGNKVAINAEGLVLPCNFFNHNLYDARFHDTSKLPGSNPASYVNGKNQIQEFVKKYKSELDLNCNSLDNIFKSKFWTELVAGWGTENRIMECAMTCGEKFTKVWDQGGSIR